MNNSIPELPLRDIHLPASISWWPPALGWWIIIVFLLLLIVLAILMTRSYLKPTLKKQACKQLNLIEKNFHRSGDASQCLSELSAFLRRISLCQNHPVTTAGLTGSAWLDVLDQNLKTTEFSQGCGQILLKGPYQSSVEKEDVVQFLELCHKWVSRL